MGFSLLLKVIVPLNGVLFQTVDLLFAYQLLENQSLILKLPVQLTVAEAIIFAGMFSKLLLVIIKHFYFYFDIQQTVIKSIRIRRCEEWFLVSGWWMNDEVGI